VVPINVPWGRRAAAAARPAVIMALVIGALAVGATPASAKSKQAGSSCTPAVNATAGGVVSSFCFQPTSTTAGGDPGLDTTIDFDYSSRGDTVQNMTVTMPPGVLAIPTAVGALCQPSELTAGTCPAASQVGDGTVTADSPILPILTLPANSALYEMSIPTDEMGVDAAYFGLAIWLGSGPPKPGQAPVAVGFASACLVSAGTTTESCTNPSSTAPIVGQPAVQFDFANLPTSLAGFIPIQVQSLTLDIFGTVNSSTGTSTSTAYTRLPTSCATDTTLLSVDTVDAAGDGSGGDNFTPTGCGSLPFSPDLSATATKDSGDLGVQFTSTVTQPAGQAAVSSLTLNVPAATIGPDLVAALGDFGDIVGSATVVTPLLPNPLTGSVVLTGSVASPALTITLPAPVPLTLTGAVSIADNSVTFPAPGTPSLPDVPLSSLAVTLNGGPDALYATICSNPTGTLQGSFTAQNGAPWTDQAPLSIADCSTPTPVSTTTTSTTTTTTPPTPPPVSSSGKVTPPKVSGGSLAGLAGGGARLRFTLTAGSSKLTSFTVSLPGGLSFDRSYRRGVKITGAGVRSLTLSGGDLAVALRAPGARVVVSVSASALVERSALRGKVRARKVKTLTATIVARTANGKRATLRLKLRV